MQCKLEVKMLWELNIISLRRANVSFESNLCTDNLHIEGLLDIIIKIKINCKLIVWHKLAKLLLLAL